jgi:serine/threonine-protein kinase
MNGAAAPSLGSCPHCGQPHAEDVLVCPKESKVLPLEGRILDGKFRFTKLLGAGGMGAVWRAQNVRVKKAVAIKLMHPEFAGNPGILDRFKQEATAAGEIGSQHICDVYDFGPSVLGPYIVLEMLNGRSLGDLISQFGRVDPGLACIVTRQALEGLEAAHRAGIVHRDLKPENIFLHEPQPGRLLVKLMDFGISKFSQAGGGGKTSAGVLMGTPEYMSPEQSEGAANADARTDIWAMGAILYKALTGVEAFAGATMAATLVAVATREPRPIAELAPNVPPELVAVVTRCLRKRPEERYATARELSDALAPFEQLAAGLPPPPIAPSTGTFATAAPQTSAATSAPPPTSAPGGTMVSPAAGPPQATMITGHGPPAQGGQAATFVGNLAPAATDDRWSIGAAGPTEEQRPTMTGRDQGGGSKLPLALLVLLLVGAVAGVLVFMRSGKPRVDDGKAVVATTPADTKTPDVPVVDPTAGAGATAGTVTPPPDPTGGATAGTTPPPDPTAGDTKAGDDKGEAGDDKGEDTKGDEPAKGDKPPKPAKKPELSLLVKEGAMYAPKVGSGSFTNQKDAQSYCAGLRSKDFANLEQWTLASVAEALRFKAHPEVNKRLYWTRDAPSGGRVKQVQMIGGRVVERAVNDDRITGYALCVAKR